VQDTIKGRLENLLPKRRVVGKRGVLNFTVGVKEIRLSGTKGDLLRWTEVSSKGCHKKGAELEKEKRLTMGLRATGRWGVRC